MGGFLGFRALVCGALLVFAAPGLARVVRIKEDPRVNITRFRLVPPEEVEGLRGAGLMAKVIRYQRVTAPANRDINFEWLVYPECDGRQSLTPRSITPSMQHPLQIDCTR